MIRDKKKPAPLDFFSKLIISSYFHSPLKEFPVQEKEHNLFPYSQGHPYIQILFQLQLQMSDLKIFFTEPFQTK